MNELVKNLKAFFNSAKKEELKEIWQSGSHLDSVGLKVHDYLEQRNYHIKIVREDLNFEKTTFNKNVGSNSYSDLFFFYCNVLWKKQLLG